MTDKYEFIDAGYATVATDMAAAPTVMRMCEWLQISKSGFYEWRSRPESATAKRREMLKTKIRALFKANDSTYGYRRMHAALARGGEQAGLELVRALMRELGLVPCQPRPWRPSTTRQGAAGRSGPGPPGLQCRAAWGENGWRYYLYPDVARVGVPRDRDRLRHAQNSRMGDG